MWSNTVCCTAPDGSWCAEAPRGDEAERNKGPPNERGDQGGAESSHAAQTIRTIVTQAL